MKHILNNLSEQEKNAIREQHTGGMKVINENFSKLLNSRLGDSKPFLSEQSEPAQYKVGQVMKAKRDKDNQMYTLKVTQVVPPSNIAATISGPGKYEGKPLDGKFPWELNMRTPGKLMGNMEMGTFTIVNDAQPVQEQQRPADAIEGGGMGINEVMDLAYKFMNEHCPEGPKDANKYKMCISRLHDLFQMSLRNLSGNVSNSEM